MDAKVPTRLMMRLTQKGPDGKEHTMPMFRIQSGATIKDFTDIEKILNKIAVDGTTFSMVSFCEKDDG